VITPLLLVAASLAPLAPAESLEVERALAMLPPAMAQGLEVVAARRGGCDSDAGRDVRVEGRRIHLCAGASAESLRRQVLLGALLIWDARAGWSQEPAWRRFNGWARATTTPWRWVARNEAPAAYASPSGRRSPELDLGTFAASWVLERQAPADGKDRALECRLLPQAAFLHTRLRALPALPLPLRDPPVCRAFEEWAQRDQIAGIEIALATPSTVTMASMFGHVFLRLVQTTETGEPAALDDRTLAFLVDNPVPVTEEPFYAWKGIAGAYRATLLERPFLETYRTYAVLEGRDLRRYRLHLRPAETEALLQRLWSLRQAGAYQYFFFGTNCATLMVDLVNSVLPDDRQVRFPQALATTPAGTLEGYAGARAAGGGPLMTFIPETLLSFAHQARLAAAERDRLWNRLPASFKDPRLGEAIRSDSPQARAEAYLALAAGPLAAAADLHELLRQSAILEVHLSALANHAREQALLQERRAKLRQVLAGVRERLRGRAPAAALADTASDELEVRLRGYRMLERLARARLARAGEPLGDDLRRLALLESEARYDDRAIDPTLRDALFFPEPERTLGQQRYAQGLADLIDHPFVTDLSPPLLALQRARAALPPARSPEQIRREEEAFRRHEEIRLHESAVARTGIDELELGVGLDQGAARPLLLVGGAMHDERLGDQRRFGFPPHTALTVLRTRTALAFDGFRRRPEVPAWEAQLLGYRSLPPPGGSGLRLGGEGYVDLGGRARLGRSTEVRAGGGWLLPLLSSARLADHLILSAGLLGSLDRLRAPSQTVWGVGGSLGLEGRHALDPENQGAWVSARLLVRPLWSTAGAIGELVGGADLRLPVRERVRLPLASDASGALSLRLSAQVYNSTLRAPTDFQLGLSLALE
jgi:hypothetical protein